jgi:hypothetical protein
MKITLLVTDEGNQITLTPAEGDKREAAILDLLLTDIECKVTITKGVDFAMTQGGYLRGFNHEPVSRSVAITMKPGRDEGPYAYPALKALVEANEAVQNELANGPEVPGFDSRDLAKAQARVTEAENVAKGIIAMIEGRK